MYDPRRHRAHAVGGRRAPPLSLLALLLPSRLAATTSANAEVHANAVPRDNATRIMAYYGPANYNDLAGRTRPPNVDYAKLDRIMYGPYRINSAGSLWGNDANVDSQMLFGPRNWNPDPGDVEYCHYDTEDNDAMNCGYHEYDMGLLGMAHSRGVQVYPTIGGGNGRGKDDDDGGGGWGGWDEEFSIMASDPDARTRFAQTAAFMMISNDFDGLDIAWQFPKDEDDMSNYMLLLSDIRMAIEGQRIDERAYGLTATLPCDHEYMERIDMKALDTALSEINLISYDFHVPWDGVVGINAPLYEQSSSSGKEGGGYSVSGCVARYVEGGISRDKINIGLSFRGHSYRGGGTSVGDACVVDWTGSCGDVENWPGDDGSPRYRDVYDVMPDLGMTFDASSRTPLATYDGGVLSYDDPRSICLKAQYAAMHAGGVFVNEYGSDMLGDMSTPLLDAVKYKIDDPDIECGGRIFEELFAWREIHRLAEDVITDEDGSAEDPTYKYVCGGGEGNAKDNCFDDAHSCDHGTCPSDDICFVVPCIKKPDDEKSTEARAWETKPKPKPKKRAESPDEYTKPAEADNNTAPEFFFGCGVDSDHASSCEISCPNGLVDCPVGQFCFWIECKDPTSEASIVSSSNISTDESPTITPISTASDAPAPPLISMRFQCGANRDEALLCTNECGESWECPDGEYCYDVPCAAR